MCLMFPFFPQSVSFRLNESYNFIFPQLNYTLFYNPFDDYSTNMYVCLTFRILVIPYILPTYHTVQNNGRFGVRLELHEEPPETLAELALRPLAPVVINGGWASLLLQASPLPCRALRWHLCPSLLGKSLIEGSLWSCPSGPPFLGFFTWKVIFHLPEEYSLTSLTVSSLVKELIVVKCTQHKIYHVSHFYVTAQWH